MSDSVKPWDLLNPNEERSEKSEFDRRMDICRACDHFIKLTEQCSKCGCFMKLKTTLKRANCPIGKW